MPSAASRPAVVELLDAFARAMRRGGWRWYVFGAQAAVAWGRPRMTADVDVAVDLAGAPGRELLGELGADAIDLRFEPSPTFLAGARLLPLVHAPTGLPIDLVVTGPGLEDEFLDRARPTDVGGVVVPMVSPEDLVAMKILAGRRKDLEDVRGVLLEQAGRLDLERTRDVLGALEAALDDARLLRRLDRQVAAVRTSASRASLARPKPRR